MKSIFRTLFLLPVIVIIGFPSCSQSYPDQFYSIYSADSLLHYAEEVDGLIISNDGSSLVLDDSVKEGSILMQPFTFSEPFNRGLPSWNGVASSDESSGFKIEMRFLINNEWSKWLSAGYWDKYIWGSYGPTNFDYGEIDIDNVKLYEYATTFQYRVRLKRNYLDYKSASIRRLSFAVSDSEHPVDIDAIVADNPDPIFIKTNFLWQFSIDDEIGGSICSPTTVSMILLSYDIDVDPLSFAQRTYDPHFHLFGVWPRVVTHASEYGLTGAVTRYRTWSEARTVLDNGGRIAMSVGQPLYSGHLIMLAGFDDDGNPIVHDPAKSNGESYVYDKEDLSKSWFNKGGVSYTFYPDTLYSSIPENLPKTNKMSVYPNPANEKITIQYELNDQQPVLVNIYDSLGRLVDNLVNSTEDAGVHEIYWDIADTAGQGFYIVKVITNNDSTARTLVVSK